MDNQCVGDRLLQAAREIFERHRQCCTAGAAAREGAGTATVSEAATRQRLLMVARAVFAEKGASATVRDICHAAKVNVSAVSYHFGSKDGLLAAVLSSVLEDMLQQYPMDGGIPATEDPEARLHGFVFAFLCRLLLCTGKEDELVLGKMLSDAFIQSLPAFESYADAHRREVTEWLLPVLRELSGRRTASSLIPEDVLLLSVRSVVSQILQYNTYRDMVLARRGGRPFTSEEIAVIARHITLFSLGGVQHISEQLV